MFGERVHTLDQLDRGLIHALRVDGRAPFNRIATVLDTSPQTIARRYQRLRREVSLRVVGVADPRSSGETQWLIRVVASPAAAQPLAHALAKRPDTCWVKLMSGGTEITAIVATATDVGGHPLLLRDIPQTTEISSISAHCLLHTYLGGPTSGQWTIDTLSEEQQRRLLPPSRFGVGPEHPHQTVTQTDHKLLQVLQHDGRADYSVLAAATGWSAATVARRLAGLRASKALSFDIEIDSRALGAMTQAMLWMSVAPAHFVEVATSLAAHSELQFVAATTGPTNLVATALCNDPAHLHDYLAHQLGGIGAIQAISSAPVLKVIKSAGRAAPQVPARRVGPSSTLSAATARSAAGRPESAR